MNPDIQYGIVLAAAFLGSVLNNAGEWLNSKLPDGTREKFSFRKFVSSLVPSFFAAFTVASAFKAIPDFGLVKEVMSALIAGVVAQQAINRSRG